MSSVSLEVLSVQLKNTLDPDPVTRKQAEQNLKQLSTQATYAAVLLQLVSSSQADLVVRQVAAVSFKNCVKYRWEVQYNEQELVHGEELSEEDKSYVRGNIIAPNVIQAPQMIRAQVLEALTMISRVDFPGKWPDLLPMLVERMRTQAGNLENIVVVLEVTAAIFRCFVDVDITQVNDALDYSQKQTQDPVLEIMSRLDALLKTGISDLNMLRTIFFGIKLVFEIYYCLNWHGLSSTVEQRLDTWVNYMHAYLTYDNPLLHEKDPDKQSLIDAVKALIIESLDIFVQKHEEEFTGMSQKFTSEVWKQVESVGPSIGQDNVALNGIKFMTTLCNSVHCSIFQSGDNLKELAEKVIIPNFRMRDEEVELFEMNYMDYIRKDMEGNDVDTRKRAAADLVKALTERFPGQVNDLFANYIQQLLNQYYQNNNQQQQQWKSKDCAINLVMAYTIQGQRMETGVSRLNQSVNIGDFFQKQIFPELQDPNINFQPVLKADALKFFTVFRNFFPNDLIHEIFPSIVNLIGAESNVVHSYAAIAINKLLSLKQENNIRQNKFEMSDLGDEQQFLKLLNNLFKAFKFPESEENQYLMHALMRVIMFLGVKMGPLAVECLNQLFKMLMDICKNPKQPAFNHFLFESVAAVIKFNPDKIQQFENLIFPPFQKVLQEDIQEFLPYVYQIFAQLISIHGFQKNLLPNAYIQILPLLLNSRYWDGQGNIKALRLLMQAYLISSPKQIAQIDDGKCILNMLGVFQALHSGRLWDHEGFALLTAIFLNFEINQIQPYLNNIWMLIFARLTSNNKKMLTPKYYGSFIAFLFRVVVKHGVSFVFESMEKVQGGSCVGILGGVVGPNMMHAYKIDYRPIVVGASKCLCELNALIQSSQQWCALLDGVLTVIQMYGGSGTLIKTNGTNGTTIQNGQSAESTLEDQIEQMEYSNQFSLLANANREILDVAPDVQNVEQFLVQLFSNKGINRQMSGAIQGMLKNERQQQLKELFKRFNVQL